MSPAFGNPTGTFAQQSQNQPQPTNTMQQPFGGQQGGFGGQQQGGFGGQQGGLSGMFGGFGGQQGGFGMPQMQSPYGPQQGGFGGGMGGGFGGGFNPYQQQMQSPYGPQMGGFGGYGGQQGGFGGYGQQMGGFGGMGGGFNPYQQGMMGGFGGGMMGGFGGGFNPYQMQSPYGPQMGGYGGGFGGGMGGYGRGMGRGRDRMVGNQGMMSDMQYRGGDMPRRLEGTPQSPENMPPQYSPQEYLRQGLQMQAQNAAMKNRGGMEGSPQYQDYNRAMTMDMPQSYDSSNRMADFEHVMRNVNSGAAQNRLGGGANAIAQDRAVQNAFQAQRMA